MPFRRAPNCATGPLGGVGTVNISAPEALPASIADTSVDRKWRLRGDRRSQAPVRQGQPLRELPRRFIGRLPVEGHHRGRDARRATQLSAPPVADRRDLYLVRTTANGFFETMNCHVFLSVRIAVGERENLTLLTVTIKRSAARRRTRMVHGRGIERNERREKFAVSGCPQVLNASSTGFQQCAPAHGLTVQS